MRTFVGFIRSLFISVIALSCMAAHCSTPSGGNPGATDAAVVEGGTSIGQGLLHCTSKAITDVANSILGDVANAVATDNYEAAIADLFTRFTADEVKCAIELFVHGNARKASADPLMAKQISRANAWLAAHP